MKNGFNISLHTIEKGHHSFTYKGVPCRKCPFDFALYTKLIWDIKPDLIIEIGTDKGGSALWLSDLTDSYPFPVSIHTIDIEDKTSSILTGKDKISTFYTGFQGYDLKAAEGYDRVLVIDDGSHRETEVLKALEKFSPIAYYYIVEDSHIKHLGYSEFEGTPMAAIERFITGNQEWEVDRFFCDFFGMNATFNMNGYLKRKKER